MQFAWFTALLLTAAAAASPNTDVEARATQVIQPSSSLIWYHGRWDDIPSTWWPGSGFKLSFSKAPSTLILNIGSSASSPPIIASTRFGSSGAWTTVNLNAGANTIPVTVSAGSPVVFDVVTQMEGGNARLELTSIEIDAAAQLTTYTPSQYAFEFIGDSISAGYNDPRGVVDAYSFKTGDNFKAEHNQITQSGICMTDDACYSGGRGMSYLYFRTQNSAYVYLTGNTTTAWDFKKYKVAPTHIFINLGTNDNSFSHTGTAFSNVFVSFLKNLRTVHPKAPVFILRPFGWTSATGVTYYFQAEFDAVAAALPDNNMFVVDTKGWIRPGDTVDGTHPTPDGHTNLATQLTNYLVNFGLKLPGGPPISSTSSTTVTSSTKTSSTAAPTSTQVAQKWGQCGGIGVRVDLLSLISSNSLIVHRSEGLCVWDHLHGLERLLLAVSLSSHIVTGSGESDDER
ncbi:hypothetical protein HGRIS_007244 [Hohenbuehelia grisea]|uniref:SGNH hydrolase-type esterase domain-containing protein n=1 Tax=Hohenbuehelia grisea TaxID=104357 RepID=A0ABR3JC44_9AGAR